MLSYCLFLVVNMCLIVESNIYNNDNYNIQLNLTKHYYRDSYYVKAHTFVVLRNNPFVITLSNYQAIGMSCRSPSYTYPTLFKTVNESGVLKSTAEVLLATADMTGKWICTIQRNDSPVNLTLVFRVRVKSSFERRVKIEIGGRFLDTSLTNSSILEYDEVARYYYWNGETVDLVCYNEQSNGMIYFKYYDATGELLIRSAKLLKGDDYDNLMFQRTLYTEHNNSMIDCTYVTVKDDIEFSYRVIFIQNIRKSYGIFKIAINDLQLKSDHNSATDDVRTDVSQYHYMFFPGEDLKITCEPLKDGDLKPNLIILSESLNYLMKNESEINLNLSELHFRNNKSTIMCGTEERMALILLIKREYPKFRILGLNWEYLVTQYTLTNKDWIIHYRFRAGQELNITCLARDTGTLWLFESTKTQNESVGARSVSQLFKMGDTHNNSRIICRDGKTDIDYKQQVIIKLHMDPVSSRGISSTLSLPTDAPNLPSADAPEKILDKVMLKITSQSDDKHDSQFTKDIVIGCVVTLLVLVVMGSVVFYCRCKHSRIKQTDEIQLQKLEPTSPVDIASTSMDEGKNSNTCDHEYHYIDVDKLRLTKKIEMCPLPEDNEDQNNLEYDYTYASAIPSEVKPSLPPHIDSAQNNTIYYWIKQ